MKNLYLLCAIALLTLTQCKKNDAPQQDTGVTPIAAGTGNIIGDVVPAGAAKVITVSHKNGTYSAKIDSNGHFMVATVPTGECTITFVPQSGFNMPSNKTVILTKGQTLDCGSAYFSAAVSGGISGKLLPAGIASTVTVSGRLNGMPVSYSVRVLGQDGGFQFVGLPPNTYTLNFNTAAGYAATTASNTVTVTADKNFDIGTINFTATGKGSVTGVISPANAVSSVKLIGQGQDLKITPKSDGSFGFADLPVGSYTVTYIPAPGFEGPPSAQLNVIPGKTNELGTLSFSFSTTKGTIAGTIDRPELVIGMAVMPMENIFLRYYSLPDPTTGKFHFSGLPPGNYLINYVTKSSTDYYAPGKSNIAVQAGQITDIGLVTIKDAIACTISGSISPAGSASTITALSDASGRRYTVIPDANGNFKLTGLPYGRYFVSATPMAGLFAPYREPISLGNGEQGNIGTINLTTAAPQIPVSFISNGTSYETINGDIDAYYSGTTFGVNSAVKGYRLIIQLKDINGPGEYSIGPGSASKLSFSTTTSNTGFENKPITLGGTWTTAMPGSSATVRIHTVDANTKMISGTFSATIGNRTITNGSFKVPYE